jgi:hypothetical protein
MRRLHQVKVTLHKLQLFPAACLHTLKSVSAMFRRWMHATLFAHLISAVTVLLLWLLLCCCAGVHEGHDGQAALPQHK